MRQPNAVKRQRGRIFQACRLQTQSACFCRPLVTIRWWVAVSLWALAPTIGQEPNAAGQSSEAAMAAYADAANFQNNRALDLAIESWRLFLKDHAEDPLASKAAHFLGVCYMQQQEPDYQAAATTFAMALRDQDYDMREESLINLGRCLFRAAGDGPQRDPQRLREALQAFATLRKEDPQSRYLDLALFYSGESAYGLNQPAQAVEYYDQLLTSPSTQDSPLRCDAYYARGIAQEELKQFDKAIASYRQLLAACPEKGELVTDVHLRIADLQIRERQFSQAASSLTDAYESTDSPRDRAYALFRKGYALAQAGQPSDAADAYERLLRDHSDSSYAAAATLASAQSFYRSGDLDQAASRFRRVLSQNDPAAATEAAHWLARIEISKGNPAAAKQICQRQIDAGLQGEFANAVKFDLAETLSMDPNTVDQSVDLFEQAYRDAPTEPTAPRALYNAAFSAYQIGNAEKALELSGEFAKQFSQDTLAGDVQFIAAESQLQLGRAQQAAETFARLLASTDQDNVQRSNWALRGAAANLAAGRTDEVVKIIQDHQTIFSKPDQQAEAQLLLGRARLAANQPEQAATALLASLQAAPQWRRSGEAEYLAGQALLAAGRSDEALAAWNRLIDRLPNSPISDQARYQLGQAAAAQEDHATAIKWYDQVLSSGKNQSLVPYALTAKGRALMQAGKYDDALAALDDALRRFDPHPTRDDALLARGITLRNLNRLDDAKVDLQKYLQIPPQGINLGHALYELALVDQQQKDFARSAQHLERLVREVPDYPQMEKVLYELGWSHRESGDDDAAVEQFSNLIRRYQHSPLAAEAAYYVGQQYYDDQAWQRAAEQFAIAAGNPADRELSEKAYYRLGWSHYKDRDFDAARRAFQMQADQHAQGKLALDALVMVGECEFKQAKYQQALASFGKARQRIRDAGDDSKSVRDPAERQIRELVLLHGGQSASQLKQWQETIDWLAELRQRFPATAYVPQAFYETGFAYQQRGDTSNALKFFGEVANNYRNETAARARFMMGEIQFGQKQFDQAIPEFQRVMFGFGAEQAPANIKNWQAKSGFEAGRCSEVLIQAATTPQKRDRAKKLAIDFYNYVVDKHPGHELVTTARQRLEALNPQ